MDPTRSGLIETILTAAAAGEPMQAHESVELLAGLGIAGDRYALHSGHWSDPRWPDQELTLIAAETLERLGLRAEQLRRNLVTRGLVLPELIGREFAIGEVLLLGVRNCDPCRYVETFSREGAMEELAADGGLRAKVLRGGRIRAGDLIVPM